MGSDDAVIRGGNRALGFEAVATLNMTESDFDIQDMWAKYEDIAMHFNDLLMRLRSQSLAGIAAISTLVGIFTREGIANVHLDWLVASAIFIGMALFWVAIGCLDFFYYNRLLLGAVAAIKQLEDKTVSNALPINMSTLIELEFKKPMFRYVWPRFWGVIAFYAIVFVAIIAGLWFSLSMYAAADP